MKPVFLKMRMVLAAAITALPLIGMAGVSSANATTVAETVTALNMRAGPATSYPIVTTLPAYAGVTLHGCNEGTTWCDVSWGADRGWVSASYITIAYNGGYTVVRPWVAPAAGIVVVAYGPAYWHTHYAGQPWYKQWNTFHAGHSGPKGAYGVAGGKGPNGGAFGAAGVKGPNGNGIGVVGVKGPNGGKGVGAVVCGPNKCGHFATGNKPGAGKRPVISGSNPRPKAVSNGGFGGGKRLSGGAFGKSGGGFRNR